MQYSMQLMFLSFLIVVGFYCSAQSSSELLLLHLKDFSIDEALYFSNSEYHYLSIPPPSGLLVSPWFSSLVNDSLWIGRLQHSVLSIRAEWVSAFAKEGILSRKGCLGIISDAEAFAATRKSIGNNGWQVDRHPDHATTDLPASAIYNDSRLHKYFSKYLLPIVASRYGIDLSDLYIADLFIVKYSVAENGQSYLKPHRDRSPFSFVVSLNDEYSGGGTFFPQLNELWKPAMGGALIFHGQSLHGGEKVTSGTRYIATGFVEYKNDSHNAFMKNYLEETDGTAARYGFRQDDIIRGLEICINSSEADKIFYRKMISAANLSPEEWREAASSCEKLDPEGNTVLIVERRKNIERPQRSVDNEL